MPFELLNPKGLERPVGYSHVAKVTGGTTAYVAGQAPFDESGEVVGKGDFVAQFVQVVRNLKIAAESIGGCPEQYATLTIYVTDVQDYLKNKQLLGRVYREVFGKHFPAITLVQVSRLYNPDCLLEISGVVVVD